MANLVPGKIVRDNVEMTHVESTNTLTNKTSIYSANPIPLYVDWCFHRALMIVLLQADLCDPAMAAILETVSASTRAFLEDSLFFVWAHNARACTVRLSPHKYDQNEDTLLQSKRVFSQRTQWAKLNYIERVALPLERINFAHCANVRVSQTVMVLAALRHTKRYHTLDMLELFPKNIFDSDRIYGMVCDLAVVPDPRLARVLSIKRMSAMTSIVVDSMATVLAAKRHIRELPFVPADHGLAFSFITAGKSHSPIVNEGAFCTDFDLTEEPGFLGYASDLLELRPEHEFLRECVFRSLFGCFCVFETQEQSQAAWDKAKKAGKFTSEHICFLALDTYNNVDLEETSEYGFQWVWQMEKNLSEEKEAEVENKTEGHEYRHRRRGHLVSNAANNPFTAPKTSSMLTADERNNLSLAATSQDVVMFAHNGFRTGSSTMKMEAERRLKQLMLSRITLQAKLGLHQQAK